MIEIVNNYCNEITKIIENHNTKQLYDNMSIMELNWFGPLYAGIGEFMEDCSEVFYKKMYYSLHRDIVDYKFNMEVVVSQNTTKISYIVYKDFKLIYDKVFYNNYSFHKVLKEILLFNKRLLLLNNINHNMPKYISNRLNNKYCILLKDNDCFNKIKLLLLCNQQKKKCASELIQNIMIYLINMYFN